MSDRFGIRATAHPTRTEHDVKEWTYHEHGRIFCTEEYVL
jgi:hypothetical protein